MNRNTWESTPGIPPAQNRGQKIKALSKSPALPPNSFDALFKGKGYSRSHIIVNYDKMTKFG